MLDAYDTDVNALARHVLAVVDDRLPGARRMVYDNFNATVIGYSPDGRSRHAVCSVAVYPRWVNLFFLAGRELPDPNDMLQGTGSTVRHVRLTRRDDLDDRVLRLLDEAIDRWPWQFPHDVTLSTVVVSVAEKRRPRRPK